VRALRFHFCEVLLESQIAGDAGPKCQQREPCRLGEFELTA